MRGILVIIIFHLNAYNYPKRSRWKIIQGFSPWKLGIIFLVMINIDNHNKHRENANCEKVVWVFREKNPEKKKVCRRFFFLEISFGSSTLTFVNRSDFTFKRKHLQEGIKNSIGNVNKKKKVCGVCDRLKEVSDIFYAFSVSLEENKK